MSTSKTKRVKPYWIKERYNPQLGTYYVAMGQMSQTAAQRYERSIYGENVMLRFETEQEYQAKLDSLRAAGERIQ